VAVAVVAVSGEVEVVAALVAEPELTAVQLLHQVLAIQAVVVAVALKMVLTVEVRQVAAELLELGTLALIG
jgi:hypothetical protein